MNNYDKLQYFKKMLKKKSIKIEPYKDYLVLVDHYQYHDSNDDKIEWIAIVWCRNEKISDIGLFKLKDNLDDAERYVVFREVTDRDVAYLITQLWQVSQHLSICKWDGRNVSWTWDEAKAWLNKKNNNDWHYTMDVYK